LGTARVLKAPVAPKIGKLKARPKVFTIGLFGESGSGKTTLAVTIADVLPNGAEDLLIVNVDNSISVLPDIYNVFPDPAENRPVETWEELLDLVSWLEVEGHKQFKAVIIDTMTEVGSRLLKEYILRHPPRVGSRPSKDRMNQDDYGWFADEMLELLKRLRDLPMHVVLTMQTKDLVVDSPESQSQLYRYPSFGEGNKTSAEANQYLDLVGYLSVVPGKRGADGSQEIKRTMLLYPMANRKAKIRTRPGVVAPAFLEDDEMNLTHILKTYMLPEGEDK